MSDHTLTLSSGLKLGYAEYGDPGGVPLLFHHGWPSSRLQGELLHDTGVRLGLRIISPDRPGLGLSDFQPRRTLADWPPLVEEITALLGIKRFHVLGVSGGGPYVLVTAHALPARLLSAGVICGAPPLREVGTQHLMWPYRLALWGQRHVPFLLAPGLAMAANFLGKPRESQAVRKFAATLCEQDQKAMSDPRLYRILTQSGRTGLLSGARAVTADGNIYSSDWGFDSAGVTYPLRYWHGELDRNIPASLVRKFTDRLPNATLTLLAEDGHYSLPMLRSPEIVAELISGTAGA